MRKKWILAFYSFLLGFLFSFWIFSKRFITINKESKRKNDKLYKSYVLLIEWLSWKSRKKNIAEWLLNRDIKSVAIYGMGELGNRLYEDLSKFEDVINVNYVIDNNITNTFSELPVLSLEDNLPKVDAIIVTPFFAFESIENPIKKKLPDTNIISLAEIFDI